MLMRNAHPAQKGLTLRNLTLLPVPLVLQTLTVTKVVQPPVPLAQMTRIRTLKLLCAHHDCVCVFPFIHERGSERILLLTSHNSVHYTRLRAVLYQMHRPSTRSTDFGL